MPNQNQNKSHQIIQSFEAKAKRKRPLTQRVADSLTRYFGSLHFLSLNIIVFTLWVLINSKVIPILPVFDPYPFVLLITTVSLEAIILTTIVLMSQNRQSQIGTLRDELQLQVELITERELTKSLHMIKKLLEKKGIKLDDSELNEMLEAVNTSFIERKLEEQLKK